jgi:hypothetical protein
MTGSWALPLNADSVLTETDRPQKCQEKEGSVLSKTGQTTGILGKRQPPEKRQNTKRRSPMRVDPHCPPLQEH